MTDETTTPDQAPAPAKKAVAKKAVAKKAASSARTTNVVMTGSTYDAATGDVVKVSAADAERLIANGHAREPRPGEVKAAADKA